MIDRPSDAIALLKADHRQVEQMFKECWGANTIDAAKEELAEDICQALTIHAMIEKEIAYPAFREAGVDPRTMDETEIEHASFEHLVEDLQKMRAGDEQFDAAVKVLCKYVEHHVEKEENEIFPKAQASKADLVGIGRRLADRKREMMKGLTAQPAGVEPPSATR
jgi:hemerythrin superfamily protein